MSNLTNLIKKELRELITPATLMPMVIMVLVLASLGSVLNSTIDEITTTGTLGKIGFMNNDDGDYGELAEKTVTSLYSGSDNLVIFESTTLTDQDIMDLIKSNNIPALIIIESGYSERITNGYKGIISVYWSQDAPKYTPAITVNTILSAINSVTSDLVAKDMGLNVSPSVILSPIAESDHLIMNGAIYSGYTPDDVNNAISTQNIFISIMIMMVIIMIGSIVISSMGGEKENKTLETLLTLPISRTTVVGGKIIGSAIAGLLFGAMYLVGIISMMGSTMSGGGTVLSDLGISMTLVDWLIVIVFLFMAILCALGLCMILGAFTKNYKAAQTLIMPISVLAMVPMFMNIIGNFQDLSGPLQAVMFAIPFSHPMIIITNLIFGDTTMIIAGFLYLSAFAAVTLYITVRLYRSDILLTGFIRKTNERTSKQRKFGFSLIRK